MYIRRRRFKRPRQRGGQAIVEYAAIIAFVAVIVALVFSVNGELATGVSAAFSAITGQLNSLASEGAQGS